MLCWLCAWLEHVVFALFLTIFINEWYERGLLGLADLLLRVIKKLPWMGDVIDQILKGEVQTFTKQIKSQDPGRGKPVACIPEKGIPTDELTKELELIKAGDIDVEDGKIFAYVYTSEGDNFKLQQKAYDLFCESTGLGNDHDHIVKLFHQAFMHENALNPAIFPSLRRFETETIAMTAGMLNGDERVVGSLTSGGTESILMALKTYRDRARKLFPQIKNPEMVAPVTIHPAHEKAAHYFGITIVHVPINKDFQPDLNEYEQAITPRTIALLCSAPQYCHGIVDPIEGIAAIAVKRSLPLHVDACFGGFMLPWVEKLGYPVPKFDFRIPGVTSISADIHKYGYGVKGASVVLYRNEELRRFQIFAYSQWPGGLFGSPSMAGTRPGGNIAAAWAALRATGQDGYLKMAEKLMNATEHLKTAIKKIPGLCILGQPCMTAFAIGSSDKDISILAVADVMEESGWKMERQQLPDSLHCSLMPNHLAVVDQLIEALGQAVATVKSNKALAKKGTAAMYGMVGLIPDKTLIDDFIVNFFSEMYKS